ncbi:hypothetical protein CHL67_05350 [Prosthecochloris sp. GSB1]|uniref:YdbL family protein n=1 Tax=Prosthecochloris sp. GSB1 TaxID=281093 RepID=UPI000B8CBEB6|nr:YdbL family protein [Prosthecochloris sp. GSB1]ASQ90424.1 hypothetical protein CHL67_05350 [Prosthecochloris sp. GSB1]
MNTATMNHTRRACRRIVLFAALLLSFTGSALAIDLDGALKKGVAGEVDNGYLAVPPGASREAAELIGTVNNERRSAYQELARKNGVTPEIAGKVTFEKRYPGFPPGTWISIQGRWSQK